MDKDQESSSSIEVSEEEEEVWSEDGSTTDAENEEINYWEGLRFGILPFPAPLRLQSMLFIIGHLEEYENETLALLPPRTRRELLLHLPVSDVCRLEGSGVTENINMEEVWKILYYNRLPTHQKELQQFLTTVDDNEEMDSWKECYFTSLYNIRLYKPKYFFAGDCECLYGPHLQQDLLYGMYSYNGTLEVQECFGPLTRSCFGVETCARYCSRLTPSRYSWQYPDARSIALRRDDHSPSTTIYATIPTLVEEYKFEAKEFFASHNVLTQYFDDKCFTDDYFHYWKLFLGSVRSLLVTHDEEQLHPGWKHILNAIFCSPHCKLSKLSIHVYRSHEYRNSGYDEVNQMMVSLVPYLSPTPGLDTLAVSYAHLRKVHIVGAIQSITDAFNTSLILNHQNALEVVSIHSCDCSSSDAHLTLALTTLVKKSSFRELTLHYTKIPTSLVLKLLHGFFGSHSTNHQQLSFNSVKVIPAKTAEVVSTPPSAVVGSKSMEIVQCELQPEIASLFPSSMSFQKLTLDDDDIGPEKFNVLDLFSHVQSLQVENMSLSVCASNQNSKAIVNLLNLVETCNWSLHFQFVISTPHKHWNVQSEDIATVVDAVTNITPTLGQLLAKGIVTVLSFASNSYFNKLPDSVFESLLEVIFQGIQHSRSRIELDLSDCQLSYSFLECLYYTWNRCTDVKLKKLSLSWNELPQDISNLQQMTDKLIRTSDEFIDDSDEFINDSD